MVLDLVVCITSHIFVYGEGSVVVLFFVVHSCFEVWGL